MTSWQHQRWLNEGAPWELATPIREVVEYARRHGVQFLGTLGNEEHLDAQPPEDHTPYSETAWPVPLPGDYVTACDLGNTHGLGPAILRDARAGRCPWLKYMNFGGRSYSHEDGFKSGWMNADEHIHLSCRSDWCTRSIGDYDPLGTSPAPATEEDPMFLVQKPGDPRVYLANMITRRWVRNEEDLANIRLQATNGTISVWHNGEIVPTDDPEAWGMFVGAGSPAPAPPPAGDFDYDLLAAKVADLLAERLKS